MNIRNINQKPCNLLYLLNLYFNMKTLFTYLFLTISLVASAQFGTPAQTDNQWNANWIFVPGEDATAQGLYIFRKKLTLDAKPESFIVKVSADNRYKLYVNEKLVSLGPALGDLQHWNYETVDIAPYLNAGDNILAAKVWNEGSLKPVSQITARTGFILQGADEQSQLANSNDSWKCIKDNSYTPIRQTTRGYYAAGAGDQIDMNSSIKGWDKLSLEDSGWKQAEPLFVSTSGNRMGGGGRSPWTLVPSILPQMELTPLRLVELRKSEGVNAPSTFPKQKTSITVPANSTATLLLDQTFLTDAYPTLLFSNGKDGKITITYAEALYDEEGNKNNRNEIEGKTISGRQDIIISDGSTGQNFTTLNYRTYRYVEIKVETANTPLVVDDFFGTYTGYPFEMNASLDTDIAELDKIMEIGWRTARLCAVETYMDCPYYERLQYIGDARIQMLVSYYNSGDDRLAKHGLNLMGYSRQRDGYTFSRYPDAQGQIIPTYSLWYVSMLYDYMMYGSDPEFLNDKLAGTRQILDYFIGYIDDGSVKNVPNWNFSDWADGWQRGTAPIGADGSSSMMDFHLLMSLQSAIELERYKGMEEYADFYSALADKLSETIQNKYWDASRGLFADTPEKDKFSQHTNTMAILAGLVDGAAAKAIAEKILSDTTLTEASIYFKYYTHLALAKAGLGDQYLEWLDIWRKNIELGMTTWGETSAVENTRSDCHAWGSSPNIELFRITLGIESASPLFKVS